MPHPASKDISKCFNFVPVDSTLRRMTTQEHPRYEKARCCHCEGAGCIYCDKTGYVLVRSPSCLCRHCGGAGCIYCGFTGWAGLKGKFDE